MLRDYLGGGALHPLRRRVACLEFEGLLTVECARGWRLAARGREAMVVSGMACPSPGQALEHERGLAVRNAHAISTRSPVWTWVYEAGSWN